MNAGTTGGEISQRLVSSGIDVGVRRSRDSSSGKIKVEYRHWIVRPVRDSQGRLSPPPLSADIVDARVQALLERRKATQPAGVRGAGCAFKNPPGLFAGRLIDRAD
jgi:UDP-N-acetylmuramate dehydrogenase